MNYDNTRYLHERGLEIEQQEHRSIFSLAPATDGTIQFPEDRNLTEVTEREIVGTCTRCGLPVYEDDTAQNYCEGCEE